MSDLELDRNYRRGDTGPKVKLIQEWLCLHGIQVAIDSDFGPATDGAVKLFQRQSQLTPDGVVGPLTFAQLIKPMTDALAPLPPAGNIGAMVVGYAQQHLRSAPREVGGENCGPWVRLYMNGNDGAVWRWCAGFACYVLKQACATMGTTLPIEPSFMCNTLAQEAQQASRFLAGGVGADHTALTPGSFFLNRKTATAATDWVHTGIVTDIQPEIFQTIEGNTNDLGSSEGYEVCQRVRSYGPRDFILIA